MKNLFLFTLITLFIHPTASFSQDFWEELPFVDTTLIKCIAINNEDEIFLGTGGASENGGVLQSEDGGYTWEKVYDNGVHAVYSIAISKQDVIYIGKGGGTTFMLSEDNGETWVSKDVPSIFNILKILPIGEDTVLVSCWEPNGALLLRSPDRGNTWDTIFNTVGFDEYVSDIIFSSPSDLIISLNTYSEGSGGVYKSTDNGSSWNFLGLLNHQVTSLAFNNNNDLFAGSRSGWGPPATSGLFIMRHDEDKWDKLTNTTVTDIVINSEDHIYCTNFSASINIIRSINDGENFEVINSGIPDGGAMDEIISDSNEYLYVINPVTLGKSINTTVYMEEFGIENAGSQLLIFPNPVTNSQIVSVQCINPTQILRSFNLYSIGEKKIPINYSFDVENIISVDISKLPVGIYFVEVICGNDTYITKLVKY